MNKFHDKAKKIFAKHPKQDVLYFTDDEQAFFTENPARNHGATLKVKAVTKVERQDIAGDGKEKGKK